MYMVFKHTIGAGLYITLIYIIWINLKIRRKRVSIKKVIHLVNNNHTNNNTYNNKENQLQQNKNKQINLF